MNVLRIQIRVVCLIVAVSIMPLLFVAPAYARVFRGLGVAFEDQFHQTANLPWSHVYKANMTMNGRPAIMQLYAVHYTEPAVEQLSHRFEQLGAEVFMSPSGGGATGLARWPDREAKFFVLAAPSESMKQVFIYYPDPRSRGRKTKFPVPEYPHGEVMNVVSDDDTGVFFATIKTQHTSADAHTFYMQALMGCGWKIKMPARVSGGNVSGMATYTKGRKICYVQSEMSQSNANVITLLVKEGSL